MGLNEPCKSGDQIVGKARESQESPVELLRLSDVASWLWWMPWEEKEEGREENAKVPGTTWHSCCYPCAKSALWLLGVVTPWGMDEPPLQRWHSNLETSLPPDEITSAAAAAAAARWWY